MKKLLGDEFDSFMASYDSPSSIGLRVNSLKLSPGEFSSLSPFPLTSIPWTQSGFTLPIDSRPGKHPYHAAGLYYLQDPSAMAVAELLDPQPGDRVLDLAAAPGGKSTHMAAKMGNQGLLVANDIHPRRVRDLSKNLERWGAQNTVVLNETPSRLVEHFGAYFDKVLVDAPCSGEGMFRKDPASRQEWTPKFVESCAVRQDGILRDAARLVRPGGRLGYATCTFAPEEDEGTIGRFLDEHPDFEIAHLPSYQGFSASHIPKLADTVRIWPHKAPGEGHFIAILQRKDNSDSALSRPPERWSGSNSGDWQPDFDSFTKATLKWKPPRNRLSLQGAYLYLIPEDVPELGGLRVVHWGWWLGTVKVKRFEPAHGLAMALRPGDFQDVFPLEAGDPRTMAYLHGDVFPSPGPKGWVLVTVDGFPLGWGKRVQNRLKSHSPKWLRWM
ncbi:MAG: RsmB/NOP family class I SAM-dependent RNA methyltransferase [Anaerolineales bacterium]|nr:RsmB/NOP family class I SAM-dependent RNA methyltransferase [Anaerolineales bacterium]